MLGTPVIVGLNAGLGLGAGCLFFRACVTPGRKAILLSRFTLKSRV